MGRWRNRDAKHVTNRCGVTNTRIEFAGIEACPAPHIFSERIDMPKKILIACEFSGVVRDAFIAKGHDAVSCDLLPTERPGPHIQGNVLDILNDGWDLMIAHPPCTYLCNSGVRWLYRGVQLNEDRWYLMRKGSQFFKRLLDAGIPKICVENPIPHGYALKIIGRKYDQIIQPWQFGHGETKATCLWLKGLRKLGVTKLVTGRDGRIHKMTPSENRSKLRSITYQGIADAMAGQWG